MGTWRVADIDRVMPVIQALNKLEWPQTRAAVREFLEGFGWVPTPKGLGMLSNLGVTPGAVFLPAVEDQLTRISFAACDAFPGDDLEEKSDFLQDAFVNYATSFQEMWGRPMLTRSAPVFEMWWSNGNGCVIKLERARKSVMIEFVTPLGVSIDQIPTFDYEFR